MTKWKGITKIEVIIGVLVLVVFICYMTVGITLINKIGESGLKSIIESVWYGETKK